MSEVILKPTKHEELEFLDASVSTPPLFTSASEACMLLKKNGGQGQALYNIKLANYLTDPKNHIMGTVNDFHSISYQYAYVISDFVLALQVCDYALQLFPYDQTLLSDAFIYCGKIGQFERGKQYITLAEQIEKRRWNKYMFSCLIEYYQSYLAQCPSGEIDEIFDTAVNLAKECQYYLPLEDRGYCKEAELLIYMHRMDEAKEVLRKAIFEPAFLNENPQYQEHRYLIAPKCCYYMLNDILGEIDDDYELIIKTAQKGIETTAVPSAPVSVSYFAYRKALAKDALVTRAGYRNKGDIEEVLAEYQCAYDLSAGNATYQQNIVNR